MNPRELPQEQVPYPLEAFRASTPAGMPMVYPGFGWEGYCVDKAISTDEPQAIRWCHERGFIEHGTKTLYNTPLRTFCNQRAPKCAKVLEELGYPE